MFAVEQSIVIRRPCGAVYQHIREPGRIAALQPFVISIEHEGGGACPAGAPLLYRAIERVPIAGGLLGLHSVIHVDQINDDAGGRVVKSVVRVQGPVSMGGVLTVTGVQTWTLAPAEAANTLVIDRFEFHRYPRLLRWFIEANASKAHQILLARLKAALEKTS